MLVNDCKIDVLFQSIIKSCIETFILFSINLFMSQTKQRIRKTSLRLETFQIVVEIKRHIVRYIQIDNSLMMRFRKIEHDFQMFRFEKFDLHYLRHRSEFFFLIFAKNVSYFSIEKDRYDVRFVFENVNEIRRDIANRILMLIWQRIRRNRIRRNWSSHRVEKMWKKRSTSTKWWKKCTTSTKWWEKCMTSTKW